MSKHTPDGYEFGPFRLERAERLLTRGGAPVPLTPKAFEVLLTLVERSGHVVSKEALLARVWPDRYVEESNVTQLVFVLRKLLGPDGDGRHYIETVPTRGYRFNGRVREVAAEEAGAARPEQRRGARQPAAARGGVPVRSIAVLPLANESGKPDLEYLCDGVTETLINALSHVPQLKVMARNTVFRYRGREADARQVGRALGVQSVLVGRVRLSDGRLVISAEAVDAEDGSQVWGTRIVRDRANLVALVEEAASELASGLRLKLTRDESLELTRRYTADLEAYRLYLKGRYLWNKRSTKEIAQAVEYFEQAIAINPNYAMAYVGLADSYNLLRTRSGLAPRAASPRIKLVLQKALDLDETLAEAHASMGLYLTTFEWDWRGGEREFLRAIELNPNCVTARYWYALNLRSLGRTAEAMAELRVAQSLDPLSPNVSASVAAVYYAERQYERALASCREALELNPDSAAHLAYVGMIYTHMGRHEEAVAVHTRLTSVWDDHEAWMLLGYSYAAAGRSGEARVILERLLDSSRRGYVPQFYLALIHVGLGEYDAAFERLERAYEGRDGDLTFMKIDPKMDPLRADPRFARLLERLGLHE
jgi:DNA-binding winged helix-turn-helix (wHTH) protein/tetratricopeptide (TPR) repeat protein